MKCSKNFLSSAKGESGEREANINFAVNDDPRCDRRFYSQPKGKDLKGMSMGIMTSAGF
jgi:hypothetical protein